jgi:hypothetical protein
MDTECTWLLAIYAQEPNSPKLRPTALIHCVTAAQLPTLVNPRDLREFGWEMSSRGCYATPAGSPRHDGTPGTGGGRVRRPSFKGHSLSTPCPTLTLRFATVAFAVGQDGRAARRQQHGGGGGGGAF